MYQEELLIQQAFLVLTDPEWYCQAGVIGARLVPGGLCGHVDMKDLAPDMMDLYLISGFHISIMSWSSDAVSRPSSIHATNPPFRGTCGSYRLHVFTRKQ